MRVKRGEYGGSPECEGAGETGDPQEKPNRPAASSGTISVSDPAGNRSRHKAHSQSFASLNRPENAYAQIKGNATTYRLRVPVACGGLLQASDRVKRFGPLLTARCRDPTRVIEISVEHRWNERAGYTGDPRENPPTGGIIRHYSHVRIKKCVK
ncbi:hypothetical protein PR048_033580 [Dryococelus australis]|uniref:Uncharacterized protein n=1 Tax=Dryococelus australis TaxID=614101 RepID=A0ABQ9G4V9_9NEOP|nr:hypothetical protein PR048_033580 [Dryococelus australis]